MTDVQRRVHNIRATARNMGIPVESTDEQCALALDYPEWNIAHYPDGACELPPLPEIPPGYVADPLGHPWSRSPRRHRLMAPRVAESRVLLKAAEAESAQKADERP